MVSTGHSTGDGMGIGENQPEEKDHHTRLPVTVRSLPSIAMVNTVTKSNLGQEIGLFALHF